MIFIHRKINAGALNQISHFVNERVFGVENGVTTTRNRSRHNRFHSREVLECVDVLEPKMIGSNICNDTNVTMVETEASADDAAASSLKHRDLHCRIFEYKLS